MRLRRRLIPAPILAALVMALPATGTALAQDAEQKAPLGQLKLSSELAAWGRDAKEPLALIVAAEIRSKIPSRPAARTPDQTGEAPTAAVPATEATTESLLAEAIALSGKDKTIAGLAEDIRASATKGLVNGSGMSRSTVRAAGADWYRKLRFEGSRYAEAYIELSGPGNVQLAVYDETGNLVCRDPNPSSVAYCGWTPSATGPFDIKVENRSSAPVSYKMFTN